MSKLYNIDYLKHLCAKYGLRPSSQFGQNFLIDPEPVEAMVAAAELTGKDTVVEVGPGFGVLTFALAQFAGAVKAYEIEKKIKPYWDGILDFAQEENKKIEIVWGNILKSYKLQVTSYKVVANLPYQITSNVIRRFLESENPPEVMVLMVQKEVAERICAAPGAMSLLSVAVQYYADAEIIMTVPSSCFWPEPKVDSAVIKIKYKKLKIKNTDGERFFNIVKLGFANRRKLLIKNLKSLQPGSATASPGKHGTTTTLKQIFEEIGLLPTARAQELNVAQWKQLAEMLNNNN